MQVAAFHDLGVQIDKAERRNEPVPVAICLGNPPMLSLMGAACLDYSESEFKVASALMGEPIEVTTAIGSNLNVPAGAEFVLEGEIIPRQRFPEGPFGEFPGSISGTRLQHRVKINRVTHRKNPIFENIYVGRPWTEIDVYAGLSTCIPIYRQVKDTMPEIKAVNALHLRGNTIIFSVSQRNPGFSKIALMKIASTQHGVGFAHVVIAVDADVDPFNLGEVMWALSTRVRPVQDVWIVPGTPGGFLTPTTERSSVDDRLFIDATTKLPPAMMRQVHMVAKPAGVEQAMKVLSDLQKQASKK
jgi:UbiD family decarboxylase